MIARESMPKMLFLYFSPKTKKSWHDILVHKKIKEKEKSSFLNGY